MITNPILPGFNPDPCIIRVKDDYYIATSTFEWFPAIAIYHSKDLKNWHLLTHAITSSDTLDLKMIESAKGVWAPDLLYDEEREMFMITFTRMAGMHAQYFDLDNYLIESKSIMGPWSDRIYLNSVGFDPSMFKDDDGKYYVTSLQWESREGYERPGTIVLQEYDLKTQQTVGFAITISTGATDRGCIEAPRIYKRHNYYYLMQAEGGTGYGHSVTLSRSKNIWGPYEAKSASPIVTSHLENFFDRDNPDSSKIEKYKANGTHLQKSGHGSFCTTQNGDVYLCHLCGRPFLPEKCCTLGRETAIQKMVWVDDWLEMADGSNLAKDEVEESGLKEVLWPSEIGKVTFNPWPEYLISPRIERKGWSKVNNDGSITIKGQQSLCSLDRVSLIARQIRSVHCSFSTSLEYTPEVFQHSSGITMYYDNMNHISLIKTIEKGSEIVQLVSVENGNKIEYCKTPLTFKSAIDLKCIVQGKKLSFYYKSKESSNWIMMDKVFDTYKLSDEYSNYGEFTGTFCGIFASDSNKRDSYATFHYFNYNDELPCNVE